MSQLSDLENTVCRIRDSGSYVVLARVEIVSVFHVKRDVSRVLNFGMIDNRNGNVSTDPEKMRTNRFLPVHGGGIWSDATIPNSVCVTRNREFDSVVADYFYVPFKILQDIRDHLPPGGIVKQKTFIINRTVRAISEKKMSVGSVRVREIFPLAR
jgi:hypothetical protein